jgi:integrase
MAFMAQPTQSKSGLYYLRRRIPKELRPYFPSHGEFYRVSFKTKDAREARIRYPAENARLEERFRNARLQLTGDHSPTLQSDLPVAQIKRKTSEDFYGFLRQMPTQSKGIRNLGAHEQIERAKQQDLPLLTSLTIKNKLMGLSAVLTYALKMEYVTENAVIASGITKSLSKAGAKQTRTAPRKGYTEAELIQVFTSPVFKGEWAPPRASFGAAWTWLPLLLCYTGARREEIAQMKANEVRQSEDGIWHLDLLGTADEGSDDDRTLKTNGSHRLVALHQDLIDLGFVDYVLGPPARGQLFPSLKTNPDGYYGHNFGKQWGGYLRKVADLDSPVSPSHGFRHAFKTMCRNVGIPEEIHDAITGHDDGSVSRRYGERHLLKTQYEQLGAPAEHCAPGGAFG